MYAVRNGELCTKDCLCIFVCPTGATDTETGQIDSSACIDGCRLCVDACPSHAIYLVSQRIPEVRRRDEGCSKALLDLADGLAGQRRISEQLASEADDQKEALFYRAMATSAAILAEDCCREAGYMTVEQEKSRRYLQELSERTSDEETKELLGKLLSLF